MRNAILPTLALLLLAGPAVGSIPAGGDAMNTRFYEGVLHVCRDREPGAADYVVCQEQEAGDPQGLYTASECTAAGLPAVCVPDFVPGTRVKLRMTLVVDDAAKDANDLDDGTHAAVLLEGRYKGIRIELADLFFGSELGNWNALDEAELLALDAIPFTAEATDPGATWQVVYQFANDNLVDLGDRLVELVNARSKIDLIAADVVPVVTRIQPVKKPMGAEAAGPVGSLRTFKVIVELVRVRN